MDSASVGTAALGLVVGPASLCAWSWIFDRLYPKADGELRANRGQAQVLLAAAAASIGAGLIVVGSVWAFGIYPLYDRGPLFFWSFAIGAAVFKTAAYFWGLIRPRESDS
jgi:hypothetical protein